MTTAPAALLVSASHVAANWRLQAQTFQVIANGGVHSDCRVGGDEMNGFYAIAPAFGCGRSCATPAAAIRSLLTSNGCTDIRIVESN